MEMGDYVHSSEFEGITVFWVFWTFHAKGQQLKKKNYVDGGKLKLFVLKKLLESQPPGCFLHPWPLLLLFPDATNSHRKSSWNFSGHFKPEGWYGGSDHSCHSHSSYGIYGAEPQVWSHQKKQEIHILFCALLSLQGKSSRKFCHTWPFIPASSWGPRREELVGSPWWIRAGTEDFLENLKATPFLQSFISLWRLTMMVTYVALIPLICS